MSSQLTLISDVTNLLRAILEQKLQDMGLVDPFVSLQSPAQPPSRTGVSLFLYMVSENAHLKNQEFEQQSPNVLKNSPLVLDLFYLITPYAEVEGANAAIETEHMILTNIMRALYDEASLSGPILGNSLLNNGNKELRIVHNPLTVEQINQLWLLFRDTSYRLCVSYMVTPLRIPSRREITAARVITKRIDFTNEDP